MTLHVVAHPLVAHYLTRLRDRDTTPDEFREASDKIITLLLYEATRDLGTRDFSVDTPLETTLGHAIGDRVVAVPILRAGLGLVGPVLELLPHVTVGYIGLERDERTAIASRYYVKLPPDIANKAVMILDPMLATGGTATKAVEIMKEYHPASVRLVCVVGVRLVCVVAAPEGIQALQAAHPDVQIFTAAQDRELNAQKYILPGLGDYGDRLFGT
ncbi:MAG: uracil phosphoribosyltransferase [Chloroflexi bacterium]|nr:MAG: uracil phosphoribosyltransferase [Chloroflexota bacterium]